MAGEVQVNIEDQLADITADLVEREENSLFLERIFAQTAGVWEDTAVLCNNLAPIKTHIEQLQKHLAGTLQATWLDYPHAEHGEGYCVIKFFLEELHWSSVALYNKQWFLQRLAQRQSVGE